MKKFVGMCAALAALSTGALFAHSHPTPGGFGVSAEYLYMMPSLDDTYFVIKSSESTTFPNGKRENNDLDFHSGFRVGASYGFCECDSEIQLYYTNLGFKQEKTVNGDFLWATVGRADLVSAFENYSGEAFSKLDVLYQRYDLNYAQLVIDNCCDLDLRVQLGLEYASLHLDEDYAYFNGQSLGIVESQSRTWGIGPQIGFDFDYTLVESTSCMPGVLSLNVLSTGSLLVGQSNTKQYNSLNGDAILNVKDNNANRIIPALHARVGLNYATTFCGCGASLELGYEFNSYLRGLSRTNYNDDVADGQVSTSYYNYDVQGLYVDATITF